MFSLWVKNINKVIKQAKVIITRKTGLWLNKKNAITGMDRAAANAPTDDTRVKKKRRSQTRMTRTANRGLKARSMPRVVAIPLPPLNPRKGVKTCPATAQTPLIVIRT